jgi:hypothetical protein
MAGIGERVVQASMFDLPTTTERTPERRVLVRRGGGRVTRDPEVAIAHEEAYRYAHGVKLGLARILAARSADERAALRARLDQGRVA